MQRMRHLGIRSIDSPEQSSIMAAKFDVPVRTCLSSTANWQTQPQTAIKLTTQVSLRVELTWKPLNPKQGPSCNPAPVWSPLLHTLNRDPDSDGS